MLSCNEIVTSDFFAATPLTIGQRCGSIALSAYGSTSVARRKAPMATPTQIGELVRLRICNLRAGEETFTE